jgi:hypothetical protein
MAGKAVGRITGGKGKVRRAGTFEWGDIGTGDVVYPGDQTRNPSGGGLRVKQKGGDDTPQLDDSLQEYRAPQDDPAERAARRKRR